MAKAVEGVVIRKGFGRPTKVTKELIDKAREYVDMTGEFSYQLVPTIEGLSLAIKVDRTTIYDWENKDVNEDFSNIVKELRACQAEKLLQNALLGRYNPMIAKLMLSKHGYVEKTEVDNKHEMVQPILGGDSVHSDDQHTQALEAE